MHNMLTCKDAVIEAVLTQKIVYVLVLRIHIKLVKLTNNLLLLTLLFLQRSMVSGRTSHLLDEKQR
jgi:hypothetical protein